MDVGAFTYTYTCKYVPATKIICLYTHVQGNYAYEILCAIRYDGLTTP